MSKNRIFAILNWKGNRLENVKKEIVAKLPLRDSDKILLFYDAATYTNGEEPAISDIEIKLVPMTKEDGHNRAAGLNFVYKYLKENFTNAYGYAIYDTIQFKKDPTPFMDSIEEMMGKLRLDVWFNTYTDPMNFVFTKFDGRVSIAINEPELKKTYDKTIIWTSHSNPNLSVIDLDVFALPEGGKTFDDRFEIPMFWIIKFLCERRRDKKGFMNYYPTISEEVGTFKCNDYGDGIKPTPQLMQKEDKMFGELKLDHSPSQSVEELMDFMIERLRSNISLFVS